LVFLREVYCVFCKVWTECLYSYFKRTSYAGSQNKCEQRLLASSCLFTRPHISELLPTVRFSWIHIWEIYPNLCVPSFTYLLTYSMVQSPSWEANWLAASQEFPRISRNPKVHYRTPKLSPPVSILDQPYPVHIPTSHLLEIHPNIIHPSTPRSPQWSLSLRFPHQNPIRLPSFIG